MITNDYSYDSLFEQNNDGVFLLNLEGQHIAANHRAVKMLGYDSVDELIGKDYRDIVAPGQVSSSDNVIERMLNKEIIQPYERIVLKKNGEKFTAEVNVQMILDGDDNPKYIQSIIRDISERKKKEDALQQSEFRFRTFFEHSPMAMWQLDYSDIRNYLQTFKITDMRTYLTENPQVLNQCMHYLKIDDINQQTLKLYQAQNKDELLEQLIRNIERDPITHARNREVILQLAEGNTEFELTSLMNIRDDTVVNVFMRFKIFPGSEDTWERIIVSQTDVSELTNIEEELAQSRATAKELEVYLTRLHHLMIRLGQLETLDEVYKVAVEAAKTEFGFSRVALFIADYHANVLRGTYGISPQGDIRPEHDYSEQLQPSDWFDSVLKSQNRVTMWTDTELLDYGDTIATGWKAAAVLWSGDEAIGYMVVDNYLSAQPARPYESDLLHIFSSQLGSLIARRRSLLMLKASQQLLDSTFVSLNDAVFVLNGETGIIEDCNPAATIMLGYSRKELIGAFPDFTTSPFKTGKGSIKTLTMALLDKPEFEYFALYNKTDEILYADIQITSLQAIPSQSTAGWVMVIRDMSERKAMEAEIINLALEKERVNALQQLITNLHHDIVTPLSTIKTNLYVLTKVDDEEKRKQRLNNIDKQVTLIQSSLESVTEMTRVDILVESDLDKSSLNLNTLLTNIHKEYQEAVESKQQIFKLSLPSETLIYNADKPRLHTAIGEIVSNALQYTADKGTITITLQSKEGLGIIAIEDTGFGISTNDLKYIFDRIYRGQQHRPIDGSNGIGLSIAKRLIELHRGFIEVESTVNVGSKFSIYLPLSN